MLKVSTPDGKLTRLVAASQRQEYLNKGWIIEDTSEVEMMLDADGNTLWRYKEDTEWNTISGGSGTDTYKVKVDGTDTADYLENKLQQGTNVTITKSGGKLVVNSTASGGSGVTVYADLAALKAVNTTSLADRTFCEVVDLGSYFFNKYSDLTSDDFISIKPTIGTGRWILSNRDISKTTEKFEFVDRYRNAAETSSESPVYTYSENRLAMPSFLYRQDSIYTSDKLNGINKLISFKLNKGTSTSTLFAYLGAACHASNPNLTFANFEFRYSDSNANLFIYKNTNSTTTASVASEGTANTFSIANDTPTFVIKRYKDRISVNIYATERGKYAKQIMYQGADVGANTNVRNGITLGTTIGLSKILDDLYTKDLTSDTFNNIVCLGDSQTVSQSYPGWVSKMSWDKRYTATDVFNAGVAGNTIADAVARLATDVTPRYNANMNNICIVYLGTNDFKNGNDYTTTWNALSSLITTLKSGGWKVAVVTHPNLFSPYITDETLINGYIDSYNTSIKASPNIDYVIDINTLLKDGLTGKTNLKYVKIDGCHLLDTAQEIFKDEVLRTLNLK